MFNFSCLLIIVKLLIWVVGDMGLFRLFLLKTCCYYCANCDKCINLHLEKYCVFVTKKNNTYLKNNRL